MTIASAPGKVLICGGYLVVEQPNVGLSLSVTARFITRVLREESSAGPQLTILSPQFQKEFSYTVRADDASNITIEQTSGPKSPFLQFGCLYSIASVVLQRGSCPPKHLILELLASNDFYSQRNFLESLGKKVTVDTLREVPAYHPLVGEVSKTGLGSSAAMTTSLVACIHKHFGCAGSLELIHRIAQIAHSVAQGKVGSGFDVYTATYGTCIYRRFPASRVQSLLQKFVGVKDLQRCVELSQQWVETTPFPGLPRGLKLILADIHQGGSSTPGMVTKIMSWRDSVRAVPNNIWDRLKSANEAYIQLLQELCRQQEDTPSKHDDAVNALRLVKLANAHADGRPPAEQRWLAAHAAAKRCRELLRALGDAADVKVEPKELTPLLDETARLPGVLATGCPGAGGYDAVFALVLGNEENTRSVERFWQEYRGLDVCPLLVREDPVGLSFHESRL